MWLKPDECWEKKCLFSRNNSHKKTMGHLWWCNLCRIIQIPQSCSVDLNALTAVNLLRLAVSAWCQRVYCLHAEDPITNETTFTDHLPATTGITYDYFLQASITDAAAWLSILKTMWCGKIVPSFRCAGNVWHQLCYYTSTRSHFTWRQQTNVDDPSAKLIQ